MTFNNPERHNAMSLEMWKQPSIISMASRKDPEIRVLVLTGAGGKAFVSGADISKFGDERSSKEGVEKYNAAVELGYSTVHRFPKPTIAMIRGYCIGGGLGLAACCDIRICSPNSKFAVPAAKLGLGYDFPGLNDWPIWLAHHSPRRFFTARQFDASEAKDMGLVNRIVPDDEIEAYVKNYADTIAATCAADGQFREAYRR